MSDQKYDMKKEEIGGEPVSQVAAQPDYDSLCPSQ